jgi:hypothetical protein
MNVETIDLRALSSRVSVALPRLPHLREAALATWRGRMINEYSSSRVFDGLARHAARAGLGERRVREIETFAEEERSHGVLCGAVVEALGGEARAPFRQEHDYPEHEGVSAMEGLLRNVISISCMSETVAVALIGAEREEMPEGELRTLLTGIWSDEVGHARFGWKLVRETVPSLDDDTKKRLEAYLAVAFEHVERHELAHLPIESTPPAEGAELGLCSGRDARELFYATIYDAVIPGLEAAGLRANDAWARRSSFRVA